MPSARTGQQSDPAARRDALTGLMTAGFLLAVIAIAIGVVVLTPTHAEPAAGAVLVETASDAPSTWRVVVA